MPPTSFWRGRSSPSRPSAMRGRDNHPFGALFSPEDFAGVDFSADARALAARRCWSGWTTAPARAATSPAARQASIVIGLDDDCTSPLNRVEVGISPHLHAELPRRAAWVSAVREDREPNRFRLLSFAPPAEWRDGGSVEYEPADAGGALHSRRRRGGLRRQVVLRRRHRAARRWRRRRQDASRWRSACCRPSRRRCFPVIRALPAR